MISALAESSGARGGQKAGSKFIPYRDSVLTWLLKVLIYGMTDTVQLLLIFVMYDLYVNENWH